MGSNSVLGNIDRAVVEKAFERVRDETKIPGFKLDLITEPYYERALKFAERYFLRGEPLNTALGTVMDEEYKAFWMASFTRDLSLMLVEEDTGDIAAIRTTTVTRYDDPKDLSAIKGKPTIELLRYWWNSDDHIDFFGHYDVEEAFHFVGLAVSDKHKRKGLAEIMFKAQIQMLKYIGETLGLRNLVAKGEATSNFSKLIYSKLGFEELYDSPFADWTVNGVHTITNTGIHTSMKTYGLKIV